MAQAIIGVKFVGAYMELIVPLRRRQVRNASISSSGAFSFGSVRGFRLTSAPAVIPCSAPPAHSLEEAIAKMITDRKLKD